MSNIDRSTDLTPKQGMDLRSLDKSSGSPFIQNVIPRNGEFLVRPGFGTVYEFGTTQNGGRYNDPTAYGIGKPIGAFALRTPWQTDQILSVHPLLAFTGTLKQTTTAVDLYGQRAIVLAGVSVTVHDLHTGRHVEFVLHYQDAYSDDLSTVYPNYATRFDVDHSRWVKPNTLPQWAVFVQVPSTSGNVVICIDGVGLWTYRPVDPSRTVDRKNDSLDCVVLPPNVGEQCAVSPLALDDGLFATDGLAYIRQSELGTVTALGLLNDRVAIGVGNTVFFSDPLRPDNILADNFIVLPTNDVVTLITQVRGVLFIATAVSCWVYQPNIGSTNVNGGIITLVSSTIGCVSNTSAVETHDGVYFVGNNGVYSYAGGVTLSGVDRTAGAMSKQIDRLWTDTQGLQMPLTDFYVKTGVTTLAQPQLAARYDIPDQMVNSRLAWDQNHDTLYCVGDEITLTWTAGFGWSVWYYQSHAGSVAQVQGVKNIASPWIVVIRENVYMVGGADQTQYLEPSPQNFVNDSSCYLLQLGRGGALDRSTTGTPATFDCYTCTLSGYIVAGDHGKLSINGVDYIAIMQVGQTIAQFAQAIALLAIADAFYNVIPFDTGVFLRAKTTGVSAIVVTSSMTSGIGVFALVHTVFGAAAVTIDSTLEDQREPTGGWRKLVNPGANPASLFLGQPIEVPAQFVTPTGQTMAFPTYWFPVSMSRMTSLGPQALPTAYKFYFTFDNAKWHPIHTAGNSGYMDFVLPYQRLGSASGYTPTANPDPVHEIRLYQAGVPNVNGNEVRIAWAGAGGAWTSAPALNVGTTGPDPLVWLGFRYDDPDNTQLQLSKDSAVAEVGGITANVYFWQQGRYPREYALLAAQQQPVDWVVKTAEVQDKGLQLRVRGVFLTAMHLGKGLPEAVAGWLYGPLNTATSTDMRDYCGQAIDFASLPPGNSQQTSILEYPRLLASGNLVGLKIANQQAAWGDATNADAGNLLVDDAAVDTLATSDGSQGVRASVMVHGTMNNAGDSVRLGKVEVALRTNGMRRRWH